MAKSTEELLAIMKAGSKKEPVVEAVDTGIPRVLDVTTVSENKLKTRLTSDPILEELRTISKELKHANYFLMQLRNKSIDAPIGALNPEGDLNGE